MTASERVNRFVGSALVVVAGVAIVVTLVVGTLALTRQAQIRDAQREQSCIARLTADFQAAVADAFAAPPAPNPARDRAVARIEDAAVRLHHLHDAC